MSEDLPTFERPTTAISGEGPVGNCSEPAQLLINSAFRIFTTYPGHVIRAPHTEVNQAPSQPARRRARAVHCDSRGGVRAVVPAHASECLDPAHGQSDVDGLDGGSP